MANSKSMQDYSTSKKWLLAIGIYSIDCIGAAISPIIYELTQVYPDVSGATVRQLTAIPSMMAFFLSLVYANFVGKKLSYRKTLLIGTSLMLVGGVLPAFWNSSFIYLIIARVIFGIGFAVFSMRNAIAMKAFGTKEGPKWLGYGCFIGNVAYMLASTVAGWIGSISWKYSFLFHGILIFYVLIFFFLFKNEELTDADMKEPETAKEETKTAKPAKKEFISPRVFGYFLMTLLATLCLYPFMAFMSIFVAERGIGGATEVGILSALYTGGTALFGAIYGKCEAKINRWLMPIACAIVAGGYVVTLAAYNLPLAILGAVLCGGGFSWFVLCVTTWANDASTDGNRALHITLMSTAVSCGSFVSSYFMIFAAKVGAAIPLFSTEMEKTFLVGIILCAVLTLLTGILDFRPALTVQKLKDNK